MKSLKYIAMLVATLFWASSCDNEEYFELTNPVESPWQSLTDFEKAPIGAYYGLTGNGGFRAIFSHARLAGEAYADGINLADITAGFGRNADVEDIYNRNTGLAIGLFDNAVFNSGYFAVGFANGALDHIANNDGNPYPEANRPDEIARIKGELHFVRAYAYYWLARIYLPAYPNSEKRIPFRVNQAANFDEAIASELASADDIYPVIVQDLLDAKENLPERYNPDLHPVSYADGRANKFAAAALLAKVYFQMGMYNEAQAELDFVIDQNGGDYDLSEDPEVAFNQTGPNRGKETIWYYALWAGDGLGGSSNWKHPGRFQEYNANNRDASGPDRNNGRYVVASDSFLEQVGWQNVDGTETAEALQDKRYTQLYLKFNESGAAENPEPNASFTPTRSYVWNNKYYRAGRRITNVPILRLGDMYTLRASTRLKTGDLTGARADLDAVRVRAGLDPFAGTDAELEEAVMNERFKEMAFEGDRLYYLQGMQVDIPAGDRGGSAIPFDSPFYSEVPDYEIQLNQGYSN